MFTGMINSLAPGRCWNCFTCVFLKLFLWIDILSSSCEIGLRWLPQKPTDDKSTLVQVMAWCRQAASHYLSHCWPRSMSRPQWVKIPITVSPHKHLGISNHQQLNCLFNSSSTHQGKYHSSTLPSLCEGNPLVTGGFPSQRVCNVESISMLWYHHVHEWKQVRWWIWCTENQQCTKSPYGIQKHKK